MLQQQADILLGIWAAPPGNVNTLDDEYDLKLSCF